MHSQLHGLLSHPYFAAWIEWSMIVPHPWPWLRPCPTLLATSCSPGRLIRTTSIFKGTKSGALSMTSGHKKKTYQHLWRTNPFYSILLCSLRLYKYCTCRYPSCFKKYSNMAMDAPISWWYSDGMTSRRTCRKPLQFPLTRDSYINVIIDPHRSPYTPCCIRVYHVVYPRSLNGNCVPCLSAESPRRLGIEAEKRSSWGTGVKNLTSNCTAASYRVVIVVQSWLVGGLEMFGTWFFDFSIYWEQ